jgi:hypothetical protein
VFQDAKPALKAFTLRRRRETFDWIEELTMPLIKGLAVYTQPLGVLVLRPGPETCPNPV